MLGNKLKSKDDKIETFFLLLQIFSVGRLQKTETTPQLPRFQWAGEMNKPNPPSALFSTIARMICVARSRPVQAKPISHIQGSCTDLGGNRSSAGKVTQSSEECVRLHITLPPPCDHLAKT